jgi:hypothetical protein
MVVPTTFGFNCETSVDNNLMETCQQLSSHDIRLQALHEFSRLHSALVEAGVVVCGDSSSSSSSSGSSTYKSISSFLPSEQSLLAACIGALAQARFCQSQS